MNFHTIIFDLDGTLYEDERVYDRFAEELARFLPYDRRAQYFRDWERAKQGDLAARIGLGYDETRDCLFRFSGGRIMSFIDWQRHEEPAPAIGDTSLNRDARPEEPPVEVPIFGEGRINIGDWWALPDVLAAHYGVPRPDRASAFLATRDFIGSEGFRLRREPWLVDTLQGLRGGGKRLVAMSNSPAASVDDVFDQLGVRRYFSLIVTSAEKPHGLTRFLEEEAAPERVLSIGDNFVNDIEPALRAGSYALYIDRHDTRLGADSPRCYCVDSIQAVPGWLREREITFRRE